MGISNFWFFTIMAVIILHVLVAFIYLMYKLMPKKKDENLNKSNTESEEDENKYKPT
jgi:heme/copper-type cytochrome/quinol oxidase subunit 2